MAILKIKVIPGASKNEIAGMWHDMLKIKVTAQPESGKANKACIELLSEKLDISKNKIQLIRGRTSREKQIEVDGLTEQEIKQKLNLLYSIGI